MGYMRHHAIVVTGSYGNYLLDARHEAICLDMHPTPILLSPNNDVRTFFIPPDGSKEGWEDSDLGDKKRDKFIKYLQALRHEDDSSPLAWAEVQYGDGDYDTRVVSDSDEAIRRGYLSISDRDIRTVEEIVKGRFRSRIMVFINDLLKE